MKISLLGLFLLSSILLASDPPRKILGISAGFDLTCILYDNPRSVECFGDTKGGKAKVPILKNPSQLVAYASHVCALTDEGMKCWGDNGHGQCNVPALQNVKEIAVGGMNSCALDQAGVKCWGQLTLPTPVLEKPYLIGAAVSTVCAVDKQGLLCWGHFNGAGKRFAMTDVKQLAVGHAHACVLTKGGVSCAELGVLNPVPGLKNPTVIAAGDNAACAIDEGTVKCWGEEDSWAYQLKTPKLDAPTMLSVGSDHICAANEKEFTCWGNNEKGQLGLELPIVRKAGLDSRDEKQRAKLSPTLKTGLQKEYPSSKVIDSCTGNFGGPFDGATVATVLVPNDEQWLIKRIVLAPNGKTSEVDEGNSFRPSEKCAKSESQCFVGELFCLNQGKFAAFVKAKRLGKDSPKGHPPKKDALCFSTYEYEWKCFKYHGAQKAFTYAAETEIGD